MYLHYAIYLILEALDIHLLVYGYSKQSIVSELCNIYTIHPRPIRTVYVEEQMTQFANIYLYEIS